jgi:hypothetical protein
MMADIRVREAQVLVRARQFSGAYYLAGYALECALKACIAKQSRRYDFPEKKVVIESWTHDLRKLALIAKIEEARVQRASEDDIFRRNWEIVTSWSEDSRYRTVDRAGCRAFLDAIMEEHHGLLPWIKQIW